MPRLKNHMPSRARNHKSLCALGQDLHAPGTRARLNVNPCVLYTTYVIMTSIGYRQDFAITNDALYFPLISKLWSMFFEYFQQNDCVITR